jgi:hypothetical protein
VAVAAVTVEAMPLNFTSLLDEVELKLIPLIAIVVPIRPEAGVKEAIVGAEKTIKSEVDVAVSPFTVTVIFPVVEPTGTWVVIVVAVAASTIANMPLNFTSLAAVVVLKFVPVIVTMVAAPSDVPEEGEKLSIVGGGVGSLSFLQDTKSVLKINNKRTVELNRLFDFMD